MRLRYACEEEDERKTRKEPVEQQAGGQRGNWLGNMVDQPKARRRSTGLTAGACCLGQDQVEAAGIDKWGKLGQSKSMGWVVGGHGGTITVKTYNRSAVQGELDAWVE